MNLGWLQWLSWPIKRGRNDILGFLCLGHKKLCSFQLEWGKPVIAQSILIMTSVLCDSPSQSCGETARRQIIPALTVPTIQTQSPVLSEEAILAIQLQQTWHGELRSQLTVKTGGPDICPHPNPLWPFEPLKDPVVWNRGKLFPLALLKFLIYEIVSIIKCCFISLRFEMVYLCLSLFMLL